MKEYIYVPLVQKLIIQLNQGIFRIIKDQEIRYSR